MKFRGTLQDVRLFIAAFEEGSFTAAAARENATQSGVSHHMRQLEELLDVKLFIREKSRIIATPAANIFYRGCIQMLRDIDAVVGQIDIFTKGNEGSFTVGINPILTHRILAPVLLHYSRLNPNVQVRVIETTSDFAQLINAGVIDFAIGASAGRDPGIRVRRISVVPECLVASAIVGNTMQGDLLTDCPALNLALPVVSERRRAAIAACLKAQGYTIERDLQIDSGLAIIDLVARSNWRTVTPCVVFDPVADSARFLMRPLRNPDLNYSINLFEPVTRTLSAEAESFVQNIADVLDQTAEHWLRIFEDKGEMD